MNAMPGFAKNSMNTRRWRPILAAGALCFAGLPCSIGSTSAGVAAASASGTGRSGPQLPLPPAPTDAPASSTESGDSPREVQREEEIKEEIPLLLAQGLLPPANGTSGDWLAWLKTGADPDTATWVGDEKLAKSAVEEFNIGDDDDSPMSAGSGIQRFNIGNDDDSPKSADDSPREVQREEEIKEEIPLLLAQGFLPPANGTSGDWLAWLKTGADPDKWVGDEKLAKSAVEEFNMWDDTDSPMSAGSGIQRFNIGDDDDSPKSADSADDDKDSPASAAESVPVPTAAAVPKSGNRRRWGRRDVLAAFKLPESVPAHTSDDEDGNLSTTSAGSAASGHLSTTSADSAAVSVPQSPLGAGADRQYGPARGFGGSRRRPSPLVDFLPSLSKSEGSAAGSVPAHISAADVVDKSSSSSPDVNRSLFRRHQDSRILFRPRPTIMKTGTGRQVRRQRLLRSRHRAPTPTMAASAPESVPVPSDDEDMDIDGQFAVLKGASGNDVDVWMTRDNKKDVWTFDSLPKGVGRLTPRSQ